MESFYLVLKNGHVIDPQNGINDVMDIAILGNKIVQIEKNIDVKGVNKIYDLNGLYVTPGLIDTHTHCYFSAGMPNAWAGDNGLQPDAFSFRSGVTTVVDTGSAGSYNFPHFRSTVIDRAKTRIFALLNIADYGMSSLFAEQFPKENDYKSFIDCAEKNKDVIKGIKIAHYWGKDWADVEYAKKVQKAINKPIMVDFGVFKKERPYDQLLIEKLDKGDITTHCFRSPVPVLNKNGEVYDYLYRAKEKGIVFDLGHGEGSFLMRNAVPAMKQGLLPDTISTDIHALNVNGPVMDMANVLSKMLACTDLSLTELFHRVTSNPAKLFDLGNIGNLSVGTEADIAVWSVRSGSFGFQDTSGGVINGSKKFECEMTFRAGDLMWDLNGRDGIPFKEMPELYGLDSEAEDLVVPKY
ncbi:amidohydrolase/deacetylase family metallohydrolase [Virgibacillus sp. NKC19-3]|uniref:amidohydrolase/deacetylase family metallohydrolase n=1 Tax=Virgibacillus saliphilus TaxID=2831674 RepID=UPI001C9AB51E|nr:amidohydrolase/deacetylase family metallohydrolase [Virgibacillus sp. NKC19-3]MBY7141767.1 amidohydrolase/deacetylase family metallohydrolase [Virgibacillus sp. NKC19-3]